MQSTYQEADFYHTWVNYVIAGVNVKVSSVMILALIAHHIQTVSPCNGTVQINVGFYSDHCLLFECICMHWDENNFQF